MADMKEIVGHIERITFHNPDSGFTVARLQEEGKPNLTSLVGAMPALQPGETVRVRGHWKNDPSHGWQFLVEEVRIEAPATLVGIEKYLGSGLVKGIGPKYAKKIVKQFGPATLDVIDEKPNRLLEVEGIGRGRLKKITKCWAEQRCIREVMVFLQSYGVTPAYAQKIFKTYGEESLERVRENPYTLARDIFGIGFKTADKIALEMGIAHDAPRRIEAGIEFVLSELSNEGHVCYPIEEFVERAATMLGVREDQVDLEAMGNRIVREAGRVWLKTLYLTEAGIAREVKRLQEGRCRMRDVNSEKAVKWVQEQIRMKLATQQKAAVKQALEDKFQIITGGPGTGKSTIIRAILRIVSKLTRHIVLAAPTGKAAKRMSEITGYQARTIHSLLEWQVSGFKRGRDQPLKADLIIVDEASMIDTGLMYALLRAIPDHARLVLVGDIDQLPSVGPGTVLGDMIDSERVPVTRLNHIFRQAAGSKIITNAHRIRKGIFPDLENEENSDFFFRESDEPAPVIVDLVQRRLPMAYHFDPIRDIQVLAPMRRGPIGTEALNMALQQALNPTGLRFGVGDKVMQIRNNYDKEVFNGDVGFVESVGDQVVLNIDGRDVVYENSELDEIVPAYAVSVHKYQGSECPCIVMPIHTSHFKLLQRNLLYTAVTRGKKMVVLVGTKKAIAIALNNNEALERHTGLKEQLCKIC